MEKVHVPPFKTQGIKTKLVPLIKAHVLLDKDTIWMEPFMGSAVVGLNVAGCKAVFADINPHIVAFYNQLKSRALTAYIIRQFLEEQGAILSEKGEEYYYTVRERFNQKHEPLDFLFLNRSCFNGMIRFNRKNNFNVPYGHKPERFAKAYVTKIVNQVKYFEEKLQYNDWSFLCQSFEKTISIADKNSFIYCDPPYIGRHVDYFDSWDETQERALRTALTCANVPYMLSTWDHNQYRHNAYMDEIWSDCTKLTKEHFYFVGAKEDNRNAMTEAILTNYAITSHETAETIVPVYEQMELFATAK
jgi:DNA adenine methylase